MPTTDTHTHATAITGLVETETTTYLRTTCDVNTLTLTNWVYSLYGPNKGIVALRFDDGRSIDYTYTYPLLISKGLVGGFSIPTSTIGQSGKITQAQLLEMQAAGLEIMSHSKTHGADPASHAIFLDEAIESATVLQGMGIDVASFVQPGTWVIANAYDIVDTDFWGTPADLALRSKYLAYEGYIEGYDVNGQYYSLPRASASRYGTRHETMSTAYYTLAQMKAKVDYCIANKCSWEQLWHTWELGVGGNTTIADFEALLDYMVAAKAAGGLEVFTPTQLLYATPFVFSDPWETGLVGNGLWRDYHVVSSDRFTRVTDIKRKGNYAVRVEVRPGDQPDGDSGNRNEVVDMTDWRGSNIRENTRSGTVYYGFSIRLDASYQTPVEHGEGAGTWAIVLQLHGPDELSASPVFSFNALDTFQVFTRPGNLDLGAEIVKYNLSENGLNKGNWVDFVIKIVFAKDTTGSFQVWRRDEGESDFTSVLSVANVSTLQYKNSVNGGAVGEHYWCHGLYEPEQTTITNILWLDGITRDSSYASVVAKAFP
jgi:hypothetical protein